MEKAVRVILTCGLIVVMSVVLFGSGFVAGAFVAMPGSPFASLFSSGAATSSGTPVDLEQTFAPFWEAWDLVHQEYVTQPVDDLKLMQGAISGMMKSLGDPHSSYMDPAEYKIASTDQMGELEGIGAQVEAAGDYLRIVSPMPGSPAEAAGILPGDLVIKVDDKDITGMDETDVIMLIRGKAGTQVHLTIQREDEPELLEFDIIRAKITIPSVESKMLQGNIAYVKINNFGEKTAGELRTALKDLLDQKPAGLIVDLRNNPGGYLTTAISVVSQFVPSGVVMREKFGDGRERTYDAEGGGLATEIPLVVLINQGSASASEIVAGAVQDYKRGTLVGETSYGKGSVQNWHELQGDNGAVRVTIALWYTPNGRTIHKEGIAPDVAVELTKDDRVAKRDPQLDKAVELLTK